MVHTVVARSAAEMDRLQPVWDELYNRSTATLFQSFAWNRLAAASFPAREEPCVVCVESGSGAAIIPAAVADYGLTFLGEALFDYRDVLHSGDPGVLRRAWQELAALGLPLFFTALRGPDRRAAWEELKPQPFVNAPCVRAQNTSAEQFAAAHNRLARNWRRLAKNGVEFRHHARPSGDLVRRVYQYKADQQPTNLFRDPARVNYMAKAATLSDNPCDLYTLDKAGSLVAALLTFRDHDTRRFYTIYYDQDWAYFSPGVVLVYEVTRRSLEEGLDCDYMTGEQPHKTRLATASVPLFRMEATWEALASFSGLEQQPVTELAA